MTREEMRYKLNELRMMLNDGEHGEEQGILVEIISELDKDETRRYMSNLISRQAVLNIVKDSYLDLGKFEDSRVFCAAIKALPAVENKGEDRPKGHWMYLNGVWPYRWECNQCGSLSKLNFNFCPDCGADMKEGQDDNK